MSDSQVAQLGAIISALLERTREGKVEWDWDERSDRAIATLAGGRIVVSKDRDNDTVVQIYDKETTMLEEINVGFYEFVDLKPQADELYERGRRSALQLDAKLDSILQELSG